MIIPSKAQLTENEQEELKNVGLDFGVEIRPIVGKDRTIYAIIGDERSELMIKRIEGFDFVDRVDSISEKYKLLSLNSDLRDHKTMFGDKVVTEEFTVIAGHCTIDPKNPNMYYETAQMVKEAGADALRGGVWKPRTSPYSFQGDAKSLEILLEARERTGLPVVTEVMDLDQVKLCVEAKVDCFQIGARNALNYRLLTQVGELTAESNMKVLLKRSIHMGPIDEFILAAEYIAGNGNPNVILTPRGTLPKLDGYRNNPDESITQLIKEKTWAPVIVDPSHSVGKAKYVPAAAMAAAAYGADGTIIETHCQPGKGLGDDPKQAITPAELKVLIGNLKQISKMRKEMTALRTH